MNQTLFIASLAAIITSAIFSFLFYVIYLRRIKQNLQKRYEEKMESFQNETRTFNEQQLQELTTTLQKNNEHNCNDLKEEFKKWNEFELGILKSKMKNTQPSYPKRLEAGQKLAVLLNTIATSATADFQEWKNLLQQYLISYAGLIDERTEAFLTSSIDSCLIADIEALLENLSNAKTSFKEGSKTTMASI